jgi:homoserine dehydrogenase
VQLLHGAAVAGGVPVIPGLLAGLQGDRITRISGILNGTCNYILSRMEAGDAYADVLKDAQRLGYAEADPTADVGGFDARAKLCILARVAMHAELDPEQVATQTIAEIDAVDFAYAKELGCTIRQVSKAQLLDGDGCYARVAPMIVPMQSPMAWSHGTQNMVVSTGKLGGDVVFSGHGAGGDATAVAVMSDLLAVAQGARSVSLPVVKKAVTGDSVAPHYLRFIVDRVGDLGRPEQGGGEHRFAAAAARLSEAPAALCGDDRADPELDHRGGGGVDRQARLHVGATAGARDARGG